MMKDIGQNLTIIGNKITFVQTTIKFYILELVNITNQT